MTEKYTYRMTVPGRNHRPGPPGGAEAAEPGRGVRFSHCNIIHSNNVSWAQPARFMPEFVMRDFHATRGNKNVDA